MFTTLGLHLRGDEIIRDAEQDGPPGSIYLSIDGEGLGAMATIYLPHSDDEADLVISLLQAAVDNAASRVKVRRQRREREKLIGIVPGWNGAGADVEAARG